MSKLDIKPWEMGEESKSTGIPTFTTANYLLVRIAPPKGRTTVREGLVATLLLMSYINEEGKEIQTVQVEESESGYDVKFPLGKKGLTGTKFRGPKNYYRFINPNTKKSYIIPQEKFTVEYAEKLLSGEITVDGFEPIENWDSLNQAEKDGHIDNYLENMFLYGLSQDLGLPIEGEDFTIPKIGMKSKFYRVYEPPKEGERWGRTLVTKWHKGQPSLDGTYIDLPEAMTTAIYDSFQAISVKESDADFDPTTFVEDDDVL
jgi:hypothetical protein